MFLRFILDSWNIVFNSCYVLTTFVCMTDHSNLLRIHIFIVNLTFYRVCDCFLLGSRFRFFQSHNFPDVFIFKGHDFIRIKSEDILISDAVGNAVPVQFAAEYGSRRILFLFVFLLNRCAGKAKEHCLWECVFDCNQHITKS